MNCFLLGERVLVSVDLVTTSAVSCFFAIIRFKNAILLADGVVFFVSSGDAGGSGVGFCFIKFARNFLLLIGADFGELLFAIKSDFTNTWFLSAGFVVVLDVVATRGDVAVATLVVLLSGFKKTVCVWIFATVAAAFVMIVDGVDGTASR